MRTALGDAFEPEGNERPERLIENGLPSSSAPVPARPDARQRSGAGYAGALTGAVVAPARPRLLRGGRHAKGIARFGLPKGAIFIYIDDLYHTLLNMPRYRFLFSFFMVYILLYLAFAFLYLGITEECIGGTVTFGHMFWFSVQTASTIGYSSYLAPSPDCAGINFLVTFQIISAALIDTMLMSLVFSRFAAPMPRASTIRFSQNAVLCRREGSESHWCLSFRVANIRKHCLLDPEVTLLLATPDRSTVNNTAFTFRQLFVEDPVTQVTSLKLGLPATITHVINRGSPLYELSLDEMEAKEIELLCFMSGTDPMTSNMLQAQHTYLPTDVRMNERFVGISVQQNSRGKIGLDFSAFDDTCVAELGMGSRGPSESVLYPMPTPGQGAEGVRSHMEELRHRSIRSISEEGEMGVPGLDPRRHVDQARRANNQVARARTPWGQDHSPHSLHLVHQTERQDPRSDPLGAAHTAETLASLPVSYMAASGLEARPPQPHSAPHTATQQGNGIACTGSGLVLDSAVLQLCDALLQDVGAAEHVRQQAAVLRATLSALPSPSSQSSYLL